MTLFFVSNFSYLEKYMDLRNHRLLKLFNFAKEKMQDEFDIVNIIKSIRNLNI